MMRQDISGDNPQATQTGDIINCNGAATCPLRASNEPEWKRHTEFGVHTGIWCPRGAREALDRLMERHGFTVPHLRAAWQANSLAWDEEGKQLNVKTHWMEPVFGYGMVALMVIYFFVQVGQVLFTDQRDPLLGLAAIAAATVIYGGPLWMAFRFVLMPYRVALRARKALVPGKG